jgi:hypothetical protein
MLQVRSIIYWERLCRFTRNYKQANKKFVNTIIFDKVDNDCVLSSVVNGRGTRFVESSIAFSLSQRISFFVWHLLSVANSAQKFNIVWSEATWCHEYILLPSATIRPEGSNKSSSWKMLMYYIPPSFPFSQPSTKQFCNSGSSYCRDTYSDN